MKNCQVSKKKNRNFVMKFKNLPWYNGLWVHRIFRFYTHKILVMFVVSKPITTININDNDLLNYLTLITKILSCTNPKSQQCVSRSIARGCMQLNLGKWRVNDDVSVCLCQQIHISVVPCDRHSRTYWNWCCMCGVRGLWLLR